MNQNKHIQQELSILNPRTWRTEWRNNKNDVIYGSQYECSFIFVVIYFTVVYVRAIIKCSLVAVESCTQTPHILCQYYNATKLSWIVIKMCNAL